MEYWLSDDRVARLLSLAEELLVEVAVGLNQCDNYCAAEDDRP